MNIRNTLPFKIKLFSMIFFICISILFYTFFSLFKTYELEKTALNSTKVIAQNINSQLDVQMSRMQTIAMLLANIGTTMDNNHTKNKQLLKLLLNLQGYEHLIAGGGIWPEPYMFDPNKKRSSYFFSKDKKGKLTFYDDYNAPQSKGYHNEEWYLPAKYLKEGQAYWSKSYIDPYSYLPMVTVSVPIYKNNTFIGISTVDIMLDGLQATLAKNMHEFGGYAFIVDRNNKFLSFPEHKNMKIDNDYITLDTLSKRSTQYTKLNNFVLTINNLNLQDEFKNIAHSLEKNSLQINTNESIKIAMLLRDNTKSDSSSNSIHHLKIKNDPLLSRDSIATIVHQVNTHWKLVIVIPSEIILEQSNRIVKNLTIVMSLFIIFSILLIIYFINNSIVFPILSMKEQLESNNKLYLKESSRNDEIGLLATEFNTKINTIEDELQKNNIMNQQMLNQSRLAQMGEMISMIAHQWRQPLGAISATAINLKLKLQLKKFDFTTQEGINQANTYFYNNLDNISNFVTTLTTTIDDFRNFYKQDKEFIQVHLSKILEKSLHIMTPLLEKNNIQILQDYEGSHKVEVYENELVQVIINILKNAQDNFLEKKIENPLIKIVVKKSTINIYDNGGGIQKEVINNIFDPYFSTKNNKDGTGLGLYMSKLIIEKHHKGKLSAENLKDGVCFRIDLK